MSTARCVDCYEIKTQERLKDGVCESCQQKLDTGGDHTTPKGIHANMHSDMMNKSAFKLFKKKLE